MGAVNDKTPTAQPPKHGRAAIGRAPRRQPPKTIAEVVAAAKANGRTYGKEVALGGG